MYFESVTDFIGNTPLVKIKKELGATILAKLEYFNPTGSSKDRIAAAMINDAEERGILKEGGTIIEATSGNTGIGLASCAAVRGYRLILTMPDTMSKERILLLKAYGAEVVLTDGKMGMAGSVEKAKELNREIEGSFIPSQFTNFVNQKINRETTGPEIWKDTDGKVDIFVAGVGCGGTVSGVGQFLKSKNNDMKIVAVEPEYLPVLSGGKAGAHKIQGIGANFIPEIMDLSVVDEIIAIKDQEAFKEAREIAKTDGFLVGISSGAALSAAYKIASREENKGKVIVVLLPDSGDRYLTSGVFGE